MKWVIAAFVAGALLGALVLGVFGRRQYASLRAYADSTQAASDTALAQVREYSDAITAEVQVLRARRTTTVTKVVKDTVRTGVALAAARSAHDSAEAYRTELIALRAAFFHSLAVSDSMLATERRRGDSALVVIETLNRSIASMVTRINRQTGLPPWARYTLGVATVGAAAYAGFKAGQASRP